MFTYDDIVRVRSDAPVAMRPGEKAWVVGITRHDERQGGHFGDFPAGTVYLVEFEGGEAFDIHESMIEPTKL
jgi:hypothetical protein